MQYSTKILTIAMLVLFSWILCVLAIEAHNYTMALLLLLFCVFSCWVFNNINGIIKIKNTIVYGHITIDCADRELLFNNVIVYNDASVAAIYIK
jgi:hypothetical protein